MKRCIMFRDSNLRKRNFDMYDKLFKCINEAFRLLYQNDIHLIYNGPFEDKKIDINHHVGERSIVFRFAHYLQNLIIEDDELKEYNLDCEYNRNGAECKGLPSFPNGTYPDLIIHKRGSNEHNLLVMEFKTYWNKNRDEDIKKLIEFVDINGEYKYRYGISVLIEERIRTLPVAIATYSLLSELAFSKTALSVVSSKAN